MAVAQERDPFEPLPPHSIEAEEACLGGLLSAPEQIASVAEFLRPEHFYRPDHGLIYAALLRLHRRDGVVDWVTVIDDVTSHGGRTRFQNSEAMLGTFMLRTPRGGLLRAEEYAVIIWRKAIYRDLISVGGKIAGLAYNGQEDAERVMRDCETLLLQITRGALAAEQQARGPVSSRGGVPVG